MAKSDAPVRDMDQARRLGQIEGARLHAEHRGGIHYCRETAGVVGRDEQQQGLDVRR